MAKNLNGELDVGYGSCVLRDADILDIVASGLGHYHGTRIWTGDYIIMPNHVHALMAPMSPHKLEDILRSIKGFTAKEINRTIGSMGRLWQRDNYDHIIRDIDQLRAFQSYIADNPTKANLKQGSYRLRTAEHTFDRHPA